MKKPPARKVSAALKTIFGLRAFRDVQAEVIHAVLGGVPVLAVMPTGAGKSLCYQLPAVLSEGTCVVVSPLIALMQDQCTKLKRLGIDALAWHSGLTAAETRRAERVFARGPKVLFTTPERLVRNDFLARVKSLNISMFVIDEVHCLSQWGHDFRPDFLELPNVWRALGQPRLLALTATATPEVIEEIRERFELPRLKVLYSGVYRENLRYEAFLLESEEEKKLKLRDLLATRKGKGIVYCATVKAVQELSAELESDGVNVTQYHARLPMRERRENQRAFMAGEKAVIIATNAFGMGIDRADLRFVIHFQFTGSLEAYYQESGRAGRDGRPAVCTLLYLKQDRRTQNFFLLGKYPDADEVRAVYEKLPEAKGIETPDLRAELPVLSSAKIKVILSALEEAGLASVNRTRGEPRIRRSGKSRTRAALAAVANDYVAKHGKDEDKLKTMIRYAQSALCRWKMLLDYFGQEEEWRECGRCDNCRRQRLRARRRTTAPAFVERSTRVESTQLPELI